MCEEIQETQHGNSFKSLWVKMEGVRNYSEIIYGSLL